MKKLLALLLAAVMVFGLVACSSSGDTTTDTGTTTDTTTDTTDTTTDTGDTTTDTGDTTTTDNSSMYIPVMGKGFQHAFWQAVAQGAQQAADELGVEIYFNGPASETNIDEQVNMVRTELAHDPAPSALALAALSTDAVTEILQECADRGIPVIGFDSGVPGDTSGAVVATASTDNQAAAAIAADKFGENETVVAALEAATPENPVIIGCLSQDAVSESVTSRTTGFVNRMKEIAEEYQPGAVSVQGHSLWEDTVENPAVIIQVAISATTEATAVQTAASTLLNMNPTAIFCSNEGAVTGFLAAVADGADLGEGGRYEGLVVAGFDAGAAQKNAVRQGWFIGSVTQDPVQIGYQAVALAVAAANGEEVSDVDTGAQWYDATNIDTPEMAVLVYD